MIDTNVLYNEDCLDTMARMDGDTIDLVVTSPPYDDLRDYNEYTFDIDRMIPELYRILKQGATVVWVIRDRRINFGLTGTSCRHVVKFQDAGFNYFDNIVWVKPNAGNPGDPNAYWQVHENMFVFTKGRIKTTNMIEDKKNVTAGSYMKQITYRYEDGVKRSKPIERYVRDYGKRTNVWYIAPNRCGQARDDPDYGGKHDEIKDDHPAIFPDKLAIDHITSWSNAGDVVYDPFMGSGTVARACEILGRRWIGSEISEKYCRIIRHRLSQKRLERST